MDRINWGIIGCGNVTEVKSGPGFRLAANSDVVAVMRRNRELAQDYAKRHQVDRYYDDAYDLLQDPHVNAVYIATPPGSHEEYALAALERGLPVYIEKPVGIDLPAARRIAAAVSAAGVRASVAHYRRRLPAFVAVKQWLEEGRIGRVRHVDLQLWKNAPRENAGWRLDPALSGGGHFHDLAPHQLDILLYYFGEPLKVTGISTGADPRIADQVSGQILFPDEVLFNGGWNFEAPSSKEEDVCTITGDAGTIRFHFFRDFHLAMLETTEGTETFRFEMPAHVQASLIAEVAQYFRGQGANPSSVEDAVAGMQMMEQLLGQ